MTHRGPFQPLLFCDSVISFFMLLLDGVVLGLFPGHLSTWRLAADCSWVEHCAHMGGDDLHPDKCCLNFVFSMKFQVRNC